MSLESKARGLRKGFKKNALEAGRINHQAIPHGHDQALTQTANKISSQKKYESPKKLFGPVNWPFKSKNPTSNKINPLTGRKYWCLEDDYLNNKLRCQ